jgi:hypothetical protein
LEGGEVSLTNPPTGRFEFKAESYSVNWLGQKEIKVPFGYGTFWLLITEWVVQRCN